MAVERKKKLADYGLNSERILMEKVGPKQGEPRAFETGARRTSRSA